MNFIVIVTCAVGVVCPIQGVYQHHFKAVNAAECRATVHKLLEGMGQEVKNFKIICQKQ
jgi:hypothetical protein